MAKSAAQRQRDRRQRLKHTGLYVEYKNKQTALKRIKRQSKRKRRPTVAQRSRERERKQTWRLRKSQQQIENDGSSYQSRSSLGKAVSTVKRHLPKDESKRATVVSKLAQEFCPNVLDPDKHSSPHGHSISTDTKKKVNDFYSQEDVCYHTPGMKDYVTITDKLGVKSKVQKMYMQYTLREAFQLFKEKHPEEKVGFSSFAAMRPPHIFLRSCTPDNTCLCIYHENVRLLLEVLHAQGLSPLSSSELVTKIVCSDKEKHCMYQECNECRDLLKFDEMFEKASDDILNTQLSYRQWCKDEENHLVRMTSCGTVNEVLTLLRGKLNYFLKHVYIKREQASYLGKLRENVSEGAVVMNTDFSENYAHVSQDEIQSAHWAHNSTTLYTAMVYYNDGEGVKGEPFTIVSDYLHHDKYAVLMFNRQIINKFKASHPTYQLTKIDIFTDGTSQHFKQKYTLCSTTLAEVPTDWHFTATSHGKGPIDGIGGVVKRTVRMATKARRVDPKNAEDFAAAATELCPGVHILFVDDAKIQHAKAALDDEWTCDGQQIHTVPNTRQYHCFRSIEPYKITCHTISSSEDGSSFSFRSGVTEPLAKPVTDVEQHTPSYEIGHFVIVMYDNKYFTGLITDIVGDNYKIKCLEKAGPFLYRFEPENQTIWYDKDKIQSSTRTPNLVNMRGLYRLAEE